MDTMGDALGKDQDVRLGARELKVVGNAEIAGYQTGQSGAELVDIVRHCENKRNAYGLVDDTLLDDLRADHTKITDLMTRMGETREEVTIVARTATGGFTRMFLKKQPNGHYEEVEGKKSEDKEKSHRQDSDLFIFEKGIQSMAA